MATSGMLPNFGDFPYSDLYYFVYQAKSSLGTVAGSANYELDLAVFDNSTAKETCDLRFFIFLILILIFILILILIFIFILILFHVMLSY